jgi:hypothetical protein
MGSEKDEMAESGSSELIWVLRPMVLFLFQRWSRFGVNWMWEIDYFCARVGSR